MCHFPKLWEIVGSSLTDSLDSKIDIDNSRLHNNTKMLQTMQLGGEGVKIDLMNLDNVILQC